MMKKIILLVNLCVIYSLLNAQPRMHSAGTLWFSAMNMEEFTVYIDGDCYNDMPMRMVEVSPLYYGNHEISIVLNYPAHKIVTTMLRSKDLNREYKVVYNMQRRKVEIIATATAPYSPAPYVQPSPGMQPAPQAQIAHPVVQSYTDINQMVKALKDESFDDTRLTMAQSMVRNNPTSAAYIARMAETFSFSDNMLAFLKYAYDYCIDKNNYYICVNVLKFSSDKDKLLDYINRR